MGWDVILTGFAVGAGSFLLTACLVRWLWAAWDSLHQDPLAGLGEEDHADP